MIPRKITLFLITLVFIYPCGFASGAFSKTDLSKQALKTVADLHMPFIENKGQVADPTVAYVADTFACRVAVTHDGQVIYSLPRDKQTGQPAAKITERLLGAGIDIDVRGHAPQATTISYFQGRDPFKWRRNLKSYTRLDLGHINSGIRVELRAKAHNVEKLFYLQPGADPSDIRLRVKGTIDLQVKSNGELQLTSTRGAMRFSKPVAYQQIDGQRRMVPVRYQVSNNTYGFALGGYDSSRQVVIDPLIKVLPISHHEKYNLIMTLAADATGNVYAAGIADNRLAVFKLDPRLENVLSSVYFSEEARYTRDIIRCLAIDSHGNVIVAGTTHNPNFPVTAGAHDTRYGLPGQSLPWEGFVTKFSPDLTSMLASTYIGGDSNDEIFAMAIDAQDSIYVAGYSKKTPANEEHFPVRTGAYDTLPPLDYKQKAVVAKLNSTLSSVLSATYLGGSMDEDQNRFSKDVIYSLSLDNQGNLWAAGRSTHTDFPVTAGCLDPTYNGEGDVFLSSLDPNLERLLISTYIGGSNDEAPTDMLFDNQGNLYLLGWTDSTNFPMPAGGYSASHGNHEEDGFILKINATVDSILAGTFLGGTLNGTGWGDDVPAAMALSADNSQLHVVGRTESQNFPTTRDCLDGIIDDDDFAGMGGGAISSRDENGDGDWGDGFLSTLSGDLTRLLYSTYIGGHHGEYLDAVLINDKDVILAGEAQSRNYPMIGTNQNGYYSRGVLLRFNAQENPNNNGTPTESSGGGGGGGGCFLSNCR